MDNGKEKSLFKSPGAAKKLWALLLAVCGVTLAAEFFVEMTPHFGFDGFRFFYAALGLAACAVIILAAKIVGFALRRVEDYYGDD